MWLPEGVCGLGVERDFSLNEVCLFSESSLFAFK